MNIRLAERVLQTKFGIYTEILYYEGQPESVALVMGRVKIGREIRSERSGWTRCRRCLCGAGRKGQSV